MTITEAKPDEGHFPAVSGASTDMVQFSPSPPHAGIAGVLGTADHKMVGRLYICCSLLLLAGGLVLMSLVGFEGAQANSFDLLNLDTFFQIFTLGPVAVVFFGLLPALIGLATYVVPLQIGAQTIAFPRAAAAAFWGWLFGSALVIAGWAINGGPGGGSVEGVLLSLAAWIVVLVSLCLASVCIVTTVLALRPAGMTLLRVPAFAWSAMVGAFVWLITLPLLAANLFLIYVDTDHKQLLFGKPANVWPQLRWVFAQPAAYMLVIPALGIAADVVGTIGRRRPPAHGAVLVSIGAFGALSFGGWAQSAFNPQVVTEALFILAGIFIVLPTLALLGGLVDTLRRGRPGSAAALPLALLAVVSALGLTVAGAVHGIPRLHLSGTLWGSGVSKAAIGAAVLGLVAGLHYWGGKIWGREPIEALGKLNVLVLLAGAALFAGGDLVAGGLGQIAPDWTGQVATVAKGAEVLSLITGVGALLLAAGVLLAVLAALPALLGRTARAASDPYQGHTLEWATTSPPPRGNFMGPVLEVRSACPLLDVREAAKEVS